MMKVFNNQENMMPTKSPENFFASTRVWVLVSVAFIAGVVIGGVANSQPNEMTELTQAETPNSNRANKLKDPITLEGEGQNITEEIALVAGKATVTSTNKGGEGNFNVYLIDSEGNELEMLANELGGDARASKVIKIESDGKYTFNVSSGGTWQITVQQ